MFRQYFYFFPRFQTTYKLCQDILNWFVENQVKLLDSGYELLQDTLACLASEEIKLASLKARGEGEEGEESLDNLTTNESQSATVLKKAIISQVGITQPTFASKVTTI